MASSRPSNPLTPPSGGSCVASRTPGCLGVKDQGDPNITTLLGDTPNPVGCKNGPDPTLERFFAADGYANMVCRTDDGHALATGIDLHCTMLTRSSIPQFISLSDAQALALKTSTFFEGGKSMNYQALAGDADGQGTSFGLIQWNFGQNTLGPLLKKMLDQNATAFKDCFGAGADYETLKNALIAGKKDDQLKWARDLLKHHRDAWRSAFTNLGAVDAFNQIQREEAITHYHPLAKAVIRKVRKISPILMANIELKSYLAIFDLCVQQGGIGSGVVAAIEKRVRDEKPTTQLKLMEIVVTERARTANAQWVSDCLSRRMGILTGSAYQSKEHGIMSQRKNNQFNVISQAGGQYVSGL